MTSKCEPWSWRTGEFAMPIFDLIEDQISVVDATYRYRFCNRSFCELHQTTIDELAGRQLAELIETDSLEQFEKGYEKGLAGEVARWSSWVGMQPGKTVFLDCCFAPYRSHDGSVLGSVCIARDLTRQLKSEEALKQSEQRFKDFAEIASDWLWEMDADLRFSWFSSDVEEKTGVPAEWHYGKTREEIASPDIDREVLTEHLGVLAARKPYRNFRLTRRGPDGDRWVKSNGKPIFDEAGVFVGYRGTGTDITSQVEAEQAAAKQQELEVALAKERELNGLQRQFVAMVSHEFRTPLAIIDGNAQRLLRRLETLKPSHLRKTLGTIRTSVSRLIELMESVLSAARLDNGQIKLNLGSCSLVDLVVEVSSSYSELHADRSIELEIDRLPKQIIADSKLIRQVLSNIVSNAVKYSPGTAKIWMIGGTDEHGYAVISVRDEGLGIPIAEQSKLFERFFRASTSTGIAGSGIGLYLASHLVELHEGSVDFESSEGEGTTFYIRLPVSGPSIANEAAASTAAHECIKGDPTRAAQEIG